jgi:hypothetical protein
MHQFLFLSLLLAGFPLALLAMDADGDAVEEVTVVGQRSLFALRMQMEAAQDQVHLLFNELNTNDDYDIICKTQERYFSKTKEKICMTRLAWAARADEARIFADKVRGIPTAEINNANLRIDMSEPVLREQMVDALRNSPELFDAIVRHAQLMEEYAAAQATVLGKDARE